MTRAMRAGTRRIPRPLAVAIGDLDGETLFAVTRSTGDLDFEQNRAVLDRMVETLELR